jgi:selenocysteine lyase/cysteine desulfurase
MIKIAHDYCSCIVLRIRDVHVGFGGIRVSPHVYNNVEDLEVLLQELDSALKTT